MIYIIILLHFICERLLESEKWNYLKESHVEYTLIHRLIYTVILTSFYIGYNIDALSLEKLFSFTVALYICQCFTESMFVSIINKYRLRRISGSKIPNIGERSLAELDSLLKLSTTIFLITL